MDTIASASCKILAAPHTGITVRSLDRAVHLFRDVLALPVQRTNHLQPPISTITGREDADIHIAIIELPGGHLIELLEYAQTAACEAGAYRPMSWELGSWHLCLTVADLAKTIDILANAEWQGKSMGWKLMAQPQVLSSGPKAGKRLCYMRDSEGMILEFFESRDHSS